MNHIDALFDLFNETILDRGEDYYIEGHVKKVQYSNNGNTVCAKVLGTEAYDVEICFDRAPKEAMSCDCPYARDGHYCKHMAAVLFAVEEDAQAMSESDEEKLPDIETMISKLTETQIRTLLIQTAKDIPLLRDRIYYLTTYELRRDQLAKWEIELKEIAEEYEDYHGFISYHNAYKYADSLCCFLDDRVPSLLKNQHVEAAFELTDLVLRSAREADIDDDGDIQEVEDHCDSMIIHILEDADMAVKEKLYQQTFENLEKHKTDDSAWIYAGRLESAFQDPGFKERTLSFFRRIIDNEDEFVADPYFVQSLILSCIRIMKELGRTKEEIAVFRAPYRDMREIREMELQEAIAEKNYELAISIVEAWRKKEGLYEHELKRFSEKLIELYKAAGKRDAYAREVSYQVLHFHQSDLRYIYMLKQLTAAEEWESVRETLLCAKTVKGQRLELMAKEKLFDRLWKHIYQNNDYLSAKRYEKDLMPYFAEELRDFFFKNVREEMWRANCREHYRTAIRHLKEIEKYPDSAETIQRIADEWRTQHKRRSSMLDELKKAGL